MSAFILEEWVSYIDNDELTLSEVLDTLPGYPQEGIPFIIRLFENPSSKIALTGAINLRRHDCVHIILGRGLLSQDEAFVIGFTMGTAKKVPLWEILFFKFLCKFIYPNEYRFNNIELKIFDLALKFGKSCNVSKIYEYPFELKYDLKLKDIRKELGITKEEIKAQFKLEKDIAKGTKVSQRLAV